ncbi:MAG: hypothetical protein HY544_03430 [Candidatus Diapherotrites archaeon]|uniref:Uncharacterized protein n=1 Tax=Candidatus Iainarchaeum sp. TaxID=3101447 RepID=A0A8T3YLG5_9ARCH|nr:hypothetical protein [Candidatus Diapherotrites archaeon]
MPPRRILVKTGKIPRDIIDKLQDERHRPTHVIGQEDGIHLSLDHANRTVKWFILNANGRVTKDNVRYPQDILEILQTNRIPKDPATLRAAGFPRELYGPMRMNELVNAKIEHYHKLAEKRTGGKFESDLAAILNSGYAEKILRKIVESRIKTGLLADTNGITKYRNSAAEETAKIFANLERYKNE